MGSKHEQAIVGSFVVISVAVLFALVFTMSGVFGRSTTTFHAYVPFAGGLESGASVRYAGGPKIDRIDSVRIDPLDPARMNITFSVQSSLPVKNDSTVKIMSLSPLGDNHLEIFPGTPQSPRAANGALLPSQKYVDFNSLTAEIDDLAPQAQVLLRNVNDRVLEMKETIASLNDLLGPRNRTNLAAIFSSTHGLIDEDRPYLKTSLQNVSAASRNLQPLLQDFRKTSAQAMQALDQIDAMVGENRPDVRVAVSELRSTLTNTTDLTSRVDETMDINSDNIDEIMNSVRQATENLKQFTATIKTRPSSLIRVANPRPHFPGEKP